MPHDDEWWECTHCCFATNSPCRADTHEHETGHSIGPTALS